MSGERAAGPVLDELGVVLPLADGERVTEVLVLAKAVDLSDGSVSLVIASNQLDWITKAGLHSAAAQVFAADLPRFAGDED